MEEYYIETDKSHIDGLLYQVMVDEALRLRKCRRLKECSEIRNFIIEAYQLLSEANLKDGCQETD